jgi:ribosome modulation factor
MMQSIARAARASRSGNGRASEEKPEGEETTRQYALGGWEEMAAKMVD